MHKIVLLTFSCAFFGLHIEYSYAATTETVGASVPPFLPNSFGGSGESIESPCSDFYNFACLNWRNVERDPDEDEYKYSVFVKQSRAVKSSIIEILSSKQKSRDPEPLNQARQFYSDCINTGKLTAQGLGPLVELIERLGGWPMLNHKRVENVTLMDAIQRFQNLSVWDKDVGFFHTKGIFKVRENFSPDRDNVFTIYPSFILWDHLELQPFSKTSPSTNYTKYIYDVTFELQTENSFPVLYKVLLDDINKLIKFETRLVRSLKEENFESQHNRQFTVQEFQTFYDNCPTSEFNQETRIDWLAVLKEISPEIVINENTNISVGFPLYFQEMANILKSKVDVVTVRNFMLWTAVSGLISETTDAMRKIQEKYKQGPQGTRSDICSRILHSDTKGPLYGLIYAVGYEYVKRWVPPEEKAFVTLLLEDIREAFISLIHSNTWMDDFTKTNLESTLRNFSTEVAYPDWILNPDLLKQYYEGLGIQKGKHLENYVATVNFQASLRPKNVRAFSDASETTEFLSVSPSFDPINNVLAVPAGQLGDPYYNQEAGASAANFGAIGSLIGHEMSHIIISQIGNRTRANRESQVWSKKAAEVAAGIFECYSSMYTSLARDVNVISTGTTLDEDISDNLGFAAAYAAYQKWKQDKISKGGQVDNSLNDQQFYLSYAQVWCANTKSDLVLWKNAHSPDKVRVTGAIMNSVHFGEDWGCPVKSRMNPEDKCSFQSL